MHFVAGWRSVTQIRDGGRPLLRVADNWAAADWDERQGLERGGRNTANPIDEWKEPDQYTFRLPPPPRSPGRGPIAEWGRPRALPLGKRDRAAGPASGGPRPPKLGLELPQSLYAPG
jgi:hypothetical protein